MTTAKDKGAPVDESRGTSGDAPNTGHSLTRSAQVLYGVGDLGFAVCGSVLGILFAIFLTDVVGLRPGLAALAIFAGRSWDYVNDPIIGYLSDRTRSRWGRRRPFLLFGCVPFGLTFAALWFRPPITHEVGLVLYYAVAYMLYDACATIVYMPYYALTPELTPDYDERTTLTSYRMAFSIVGGLIAFTVPLAIIGPMRPENAGRVLAVGIGIGLVAALGILITFLGTRERPEMQTMAQPSLRDSLRAALGNRPFLFAMGIFLFTWAALDVIQGMLLFFLRYRLRMEQQGDLIAGTIFVTALLVLPLWDRASRRWDKRLAYIAGMILLSAVVLILIVVDPSWGLGIFLALAALAGVGVSAMHVLPWAIIPDAVEWDELQTGQRHEGTFYSLVLLLHKVAASVALPLTLLVLEWSGYVSNAEVQSPSAVRAIQVLTGPAPAVLLCIGIVFAALYPLGRERHAQVRAELAARHAVSPGAE
jgi:glycoside/pentoside/hexuronide:cation symporter, GPH family